MVKFPNGPHEVRGLPGLKSETWATQTFWVSQTWAPAVLSYPGGSSFPVSTHRAPHASQCQAAFRGGTGIDKT
jgi:hypothetical protein